MKKIIEKLEKNQYYLAVFKNPFTYITGAVLLSILQIALLASAGNPWGVSGTFTNWAAWIYEALGGSVDKWFYFSSAGAQNTLNAGFLNDAGSIQNVGIIVGALLATLLASQFKFKKIKSFRQVIAAALGGILMGYGARLAFGCNIGALFSGISSLSFSGWVFGLFLLIGAFIGSKLLARFFM